MTSATPMFKGRKLVIATQHGKEEVLAPLLEKELGVKCITASNFDTDQFGTFSGEIERAKGPTETARLKCTAAMERTGCDLAIASEGSFGPHPANPFVACDDELLVLLDKRNGLEIIAREISTETNFNGTLIQSEIDLNDFLRKAKFPSHGVIIKNAEDNFTQAAKGITNTDILESTIKEFLSKYGSVFIETDMRAMFNPSRMQVIQNTAVKLLEKINTPCPQCATPGFAVNEIRQGLPCEMCSFPTQSTLSFMWSCQKCKYFYEQIFPNQKQTEDPMYCSICNP